MNKIAGRSVALGVGAAVLAAIALPRALAGQWLAVPLFGALLSLGFPPGRGRFLDAAMTGAALGVGGWALWPVTLVPLFSGTGGGTDHLREMFVALPGWVMFGGAAALTLHAAGLLARRTGWLTDEPVDSGPASPPRHVVILGGGFAGLYTAMHLEDEVGPDRTVSITLVSDTNALLFTPMLAEVAGSSLEPTHISTPLRSSLRRTRVLCGRVAEVSIGKRIITIASPTPGGPEGAEELRELPYDQLVLSVGSVSNYPGVKTPGAPSGVQKNAMDFKTLADAMRIRNHVIAMFEAAEREADPTRRRELLTFVVAGGGFAGVELAGALNDFGRGMLADFSTITPADVQVILVHSRDRILPELSEALATYALERMRDRGVIFKLGVRLADARPGVVVIGEGEEIPSRTLIWTAGTAPSPLPRAMGLPVDQRGAVTVDANLAVPGHPGHWALGDVAAVMDGKTGKPCPPTAQFALREGRAVARNLKATLDGRPLTPFHFDSLGTMCVVGHQIACAELAIPFFPGRAIRISGLLAWLFWRGVYVSKLPGMERKVRVLSDWVLELFFPRDMVQTLDLKK